MRGTRSERTMRWSLFVGSWSKRPSSTVERGIDLAPTATLNRATSTSTPMATSSPMPRATWCAAVAERAGSGAVGVGISRTSSVTAAP